MLILYGFETYSKLVKLIFIPPCLTSDEAKTLYDMLETKFGFAVSVQTVLTTAEPTPPQLDFLFCNYDCILSSYDEST